MNMFCILNHSVMSEIRKLFLFRFPNKYKMVVPCKQMTSIFITCFYFIFIIRRDICEGSGRFYQPENVNGESTSE